MALRRMRIRLSIRHSRPRQGSQELRARIRTEMAEENKSTPAGVAAISRRLQRSDTAGIGNGQAPIDPGRGRSRIARRAATPAGVDRRWAVEIRNRWCRSAQPPANRLHPSGMRSSTLWSFSAVIIRRGVLRYNALMSNPYEPPKVQNEPARRKPRAAGAPFKTDMLLPLFYLCLLVVGILTAIMLPALIWLKRLLLLAI